MSSSATQPMSDSPSNRMGRDSISKSNGLALDRRDSESDEGKRNEIVIPKTFFNDNKDFCKFNTIFNLKYFSIL